MAEPRIFPKGSNTAVCLSDSNQNHLSLPLILIYLRMSAHLTGNMDNFIALYLNEIIKAFIRSLNGIKVRGFPYRVTNGDKIRTGAQHIRDFTFQFLFFRFRHSCVPHIRETGRHAKRITEVLRFSATAVPS